MLIFRTPKTYWERIKCIIFKNRKIKIHILAPNKVLTTSLIKGYEYSELGKKIYQNGNLELLGKEINISWPPKWETIETGFWPSKMSNKIRYYGNSINMDIKIIWELHRMQWLPNVANFAVEEENIELINEILNIVNNYHNIHPRMYTISWMEGIEISLRSISILETLGQIKDIDIESHMIASIYSSLAENAEWINNNLSQKWRLNNNHLILELVGLGILGFSLHWHPKSNLWRDRAKRILDIELEKQTFNGRNWEPTTAYHRFVCEALIMFTHYLNQNEKFKCPITDRILNKTEEIADSLIWLLDNDKKIPLIGDDDAGIVIPRKSTVDCRDTSEVIEAMNRINLKIDKNKKRGVRVWNDHGMGVMKNDKWHIHLTSGAPNGIARQGSHRHLDMLSLTLNLDGEDILKDSGTGVYFSMPQWRDYFRHEKMHSGIRMEGKKWGEVVDLFEIKNPVLGHIDIINDNELMARLDLDNENSPSRKVSMTEIGITIEDTLLITNPVITFVLDKEVDIKISKNEIIIEKDNWIIYHSPPPMKYSKRCEFVIPSLESKPDEKTATISSGYGNYQQGTIIDLFHVSGTVARTKIVKK